MRRVFVHILIALFVVGAVGCSRPKIISDSELTDIFYQTYLTNAYIANKRFPMDSTKVYEPLLKKYGYTPEDLQYTIGSFSRRKSARMSYIIDQAKDRLKTESDFYEREVAALDTIDQIARRRTAQNFYLKPVIRVNRVADTARLRIVIPLREAGDYEMKLKYKVDSVDKNPNIRFIGYVATRNGGQRSYNTYRYRVGAEDSYKYTFTADSTLKELVLTFGNYPIKDMKRPSMRIDSLQITFYPTAQGARQKMLQEDFYDKLYNYEHTPQDSTAFNANPPRISSK